MSREDKIRSFVEAYEIEVPASRVENEMNYIMTQLRHNMQYDALSGGMLRLNPWGELEAQREEIEKIAYYEVKQELVIKDIIEKKGFAVGRDELEAEADAMARRQNCSVDMIRRFFGDDLAMLERDVKIRKAEDWICGQ